MALIGIRTSVSVDAKSFWSKTFHRLNTDDLARNPFDAKIKLISPTLTVLDIKPIYPPFFWFGLVPLIVGFSFGWPLVILLGALIFCTGVFWSKYFFYLMIVLGLRKEGYKGKVILVKEVTLVRELMGYGSD